LTTFINICILWYKSILVIILFFIKIQFWITVWFLLLNCLDNLRSFNLLWMRGIVYQLLFYVSINWVRWNAIICRLTINRSSINLLVLFPSFILLIFMLWNCIDWFPQLVSKCKNLCCNEHWNSKTKCCLKKLRYMNKLWHIKKNYEINIRWK
jgi:hypothetical protein